MLRSVGVGLALVWVAATRTVWAEPAPPQVSPIQLQREDAQRLRDLHRVLDRQHPLVPAPAAAASQVSTGADRSQTGSYVLISAAALGLAGSLPLLASDDSDSQAVGVVLLIAAGITGVAGIASLVSGSSNRLARLQLRPSLTAGSVGLAISGRL